MRDNLSYYFPITTRAFKLEKKLLSDVLKMTPRLQRLCLDGLSFTTEMSQSLSNLLSENPSITDLSLRACFLDQAWRQLIFRTIFSSQSIIKLDLSLNEISSSAFESNTDVPTEIKLSLLEKNNTLQHLILADNDLSNGMGLYYLVSAIKKNSSITVLDISHNHLGSSYPDNNSSGILIAEMLTQNTSLKELILADNGMGNITGDAFAITIAKALLINRTLTSINLDNNSLTFVSVKAFSEVLLQNKTLKSLSFSRNHFHPRASLYLAGMLMQNESLKSLNISDTSMVEPGILNLCKGLKFNRSLTSLDISANPRLENSSNALSEMLRTNFQLTNLTMLRAFGHSLLFFYPTHRSSKKNVVKIPNGDNYLKRNRTIYKSEVIEGISAIQTLSAPLILLIFNYMDDVEKFSSTVSEVQSLQNNPQHPNPIITDNGNPDSIETLRQFNRELERMDLELMNKKRAASQFKKQESVQSTKPESVKVERICGTNNDCSIL